MATRYDLNLKDCPHVQVYRVLTQAVRHDHELARRVRRWRTWEGDVDDLRDVAVGELPCIELTIGTEPDAFYSPVSFVSPLIVDIVVTTSGTDQTVPLNLYWYVKRAVYPPDATARDLLHHNLVEAGAKGPMLVLFNAPSFTPIPRPGTFEVGQHLTATGRLSVDVIDVLNP